MCGLCFQISACLSFQVFLYLCSVVCPLIAFPFTSTLGSGDVKEYFIIFQSTSRVTQFYLVYQGLIYHSCAELLTRKAYLVYTECITRCANYKIFITCDLRSYAMDVWVVGRLSTLFFKVNRVYVSFVQVCTIDSLSCKNQQKAGKQMVEPLVKF